jgi:hypothetical protein
VQVSTLKRTLLLGPLHQKASVFYLSGDIGECFIMKVQSDKKSLVNHVHFRKIVLSLILCSPGTNINMSHLDDCLQDAVQVDK